MENIDIMIILAQLVNFGILFLIFKKFIASPLNKALIKRRTLLEKLGTADEKYAEILAKAQSEHTKILVEARKDAEKLLRDMEDISKLKGAEIITEAEKKAQSIVDSGVRDIEKEKIYMISEMKDNILALAIQLNKKILDSTDGKNKKFLQKELDLLT